MTPCSRAVPDAPAWRDSSKCMSRCPRLLGSTSGSDRPSCGPRFYHQTRQNDERLIRRSRRFRSAKFESNEGAMRSLKSHKNRHFAPTEAAV